MILEEKILAVMQIATTRESTVNSTLFEGQIDSDWSGIRTDWGVMKLAISICVLQSTSREQEKLMFISND